MPELIVGGVQTALSQPPVLTNDCIGALLNHGKNDARFSGMLIDLFIAGPALSHTMVPGDFTVASFTGYGQVTGIGTTVVQFISDGQVQTLFDQLATFILSGLTTTQTVLGYYVRTTDGLTVLQAAYFVNPIPMTVVGQAITVIGGYALGQL